MALSDHVVDLSLLKTNRDFRRLMIARTVSLLGLGLLSVSVPVQVYDLSGSSFLVGLAMTLDGLGMFVGLLLGGVLSDIHDRRRLILIARSACGIGFACLAVNSLLASPSLAAVLVLSVWDGFFGAIGIAALTAAMPAIVGRPHLMQARALGMLTVRLAMVVSPIVGGIVIASLDVSWNYTGAAVGTLLTVLTLLGLPRLNPPRASVRHPLRMLGEAIGVLSSNATLLSVVALGTLTTVTSAIRALFPALAIDVYGGGAFEVGVMVSMVSVGAALGATVSRWATRLTRPGLVMGVLCLIAFACVTALGVVSTLTGALFVLILYGYMTSVASLLQYTIIQGHTPDAYLGRINSLWTAQEVSGGSAASLGVGALARVASPADAVLVVGATALLLCGMAMALSGTLRRAPFDAADLGDVTVETGPNFPPGRT